MNPDCGTSSARVYITGMPGSGKTTLANALGGRLGVPTIALDDIALDRGWDSRLRPATSVTEREARLTKAIAASPAWVVEGGYLWWTRAAWEQADAVVWLDVPRRTALRRVLARSFRTFRRDVGSARGRARWHALRHPHLLTFLQTTRDALVNWSSRHRHEETGLNPPNGDWDEFSRSSVERLFRIYQHKAFRFTISPSVDDVLAAITIRAGQLQPSGNAAPTPTFATPGSRPCL